ncbi:MAG: hypothetical protein IJ928_01720 [Prevotella sp.]|nr:hypothetical protein [Prevotella sp.]
MKKLLFVAVCLMAMVACDQKKTEPVVPDGGQTDSLQRIIDQKEREYNDLMGTLLEIEDGFREINEAEHRVNVARSGERADKAQQIRENIQFISDRMKKNRELIAKLQKQLEEQKAEGGKMVDQLQKTIDGLNKQMEDKEAEIKNLQTLLEAKDIRISELDETVTKLDNDNKKLQTESAKKTEVINEQDAQLHTAWYVFGTKKELKEHRILSDGEVLQGNFDKNYFTKIDIRQVKEVKLYSKSVKMLTSHPANSYVLAQDANKQYTLRITNPQSFWSTSKYLVIQVK